MKRVLLLILFFTISNHLLAQGRYGAMGDSQLKRVDQQIQTAQELLRLFPDRNAADVLEQAKRNRDDALRSLSGGNRQVYAAKLKVASRLADQVINTLSQIPVERLQEQVDELIRRAEQTVPQYHNKEAERLLQSAKRNRQTALEVMRKRDFRRAMEHFRVAKYYAEKSLSRVEGTGGDLREKIDIEKQRFEDLMQRAEETIRSCDNTQAKKLFSQARKHYQTIRQATNERNLNYLLNMYYSTTRLLLRAIDVCQGRGENNREQVVEELELLKDLLDVAEEQIQDNSRPRRKLIYQGATRLYYQAEEDVLADKFYVATQKIQLARNLLSKLWDDSADLSIRQKAEQELKRLRSDVQRELDKDIGSRERSLLDAAQMSAKNAEKHLQRDQVLPALQAINAGNRFLSAAVLSPAFEPDIEQLHTDLDRLQRELETLESRDGLTKRDRDILSSARDIHTRAKTAMENSQFELTYEYIKLGFDLIGNL